MSHGGGLDSNDLRTWSGCPLFLAYVSWCMASQHASQPYSRSRVQRRHLPTTGYLLLYIFNFVVGYPSSEQYWRKVQEGDRFTRMRGKDLHESAIGQREAAQSHNGPDLRETAGEDKAAQHAPAHRICQRTQSVCVCVTAWPCSGPWLPARTMKAQRTPSGCTRIINLNAHPPDAHASIKVYSLRSFYQESR